MRKESLNVLCSVLLSFPDRKGGVRMVMKENRKWIGFDTGYLPLKPVRICLGARVVPRWSRAVRLLGGSVRAIDLSVSC